MTSEQNGNGKLSDCDHSLSFEQALITAGRRDTSSPDVEEGWKRIAGQMTVLAVGLEPLSGIRPMPNTAHQPPLVLPDTRPLTPQSSARNQRGTVDPVANTTWSIKAMTLGAVAGGLLASGVWMKIQDASPQKDVEKSAKTRPIAVKVEAKIAKIADPARALGKDKSRRSSTQRLPSTIVPPPAHSGEKNHRIEPHPSPQLAQRPTNHTTGRKKKFATKTNQLAPTTLAGQISLLDEAREAPASRSLHLIDMFHRKYPDAALRPDAEFIALAALRSLERLTDFHLRSEGFMTRYPQDPHAPQIKSWRDAFQTEQSSPKR